MTCVATNTPIINLGAKPIWVDIEAHTGSISTRDLELKINEKTKAIIIVDWAGTPCNLEEIQRISKKFSIKVIQDAAHAFGAKWNKKAISQFTDFTCYSFQAIKHFTTGDGGALITNSDSDFSLAKKLKWFGYDRDQVKDEKGEWKGQRWDADILPGEVGYKFNMNNISAAIGLSNLPNIDSVLAKHRNNAKTYLEIFNNSKLIKPLTIPDLALSSYWVFTVLIELSEQKRNWILEKLNNEGIGAGLVHLPNNNYSCFEESNSLLIQTELFASTQISLPCGWWLESKDIEYIANQLIILSEEAKKIA